MTERDRRRELREFPTLLFSTGTGLAFTHCTSPRFSHKQAHKALKVYQLGPLLIPVRLVIDLRYPANPHSQRTYTAVNTVVPKSADKVVRTQAIIMRQEESSSQNLEPLRIVPGGDVRCMDECKSRRTIPYHLEQRTKGNENRNTETEERNHITHQMFQRMSRPWRQIAY